MLSHAALEKKMLSLYAYSLIQKKKKKQVFFFVLFGQTFFHSHQPKRKGRARE